MQGRRAAFGVRADAEPPSRPVLRPPQSGQLEIRRPDLAGFGPDPDEAGGPLGSRSREDHFPIEGYLDVCSIDDQSEGQRVAASNRPPKLPTLELGILEPGAPIVRDAAG